MQLENVLYFLIWAGLFFIMMRFGCGSHIMGHGHYHSSAPGDRRNEPNPGWVPSDQAVDPVCRMNIKTAGAKSAVYKGRPYYFCSQSCRDKFEGAPASYVKLAAV